MRRTISLALGTLFALSLAAPALAEEPGRDLGDRIERRLDRSGDRIERRLDRCSAAESSDALRHWGSAHSARANSVFTSPGAMQLTRLLSLPQVFACTWVSMISAAFDTE